MLGEVVAVDGGLIDLEGGFLNRGKGTRLDEDEVVDEVVGVAVENAEADRLAGIHFNASGIELESLDGADCDGSATFFWLSVGGG